MELIIPIDANIKPYYTDGLRVLKLVSSTEIAKDIKMLVLFMTLTIYVDLIIVWNEMLDYFDNKCKITTLCSITLFAFKSF